MAGHPLRSATDCRLGEPLPHQQANRPRAHLRAPKLCWSHLCGSRISGISRGFPLLSPSRRQVAHVLLTRSPLSPTIARGRLLVLVRLAFIRHAASVRPEPGSNSPSKKETPNRSLRLRTETKSKNWLSGSSRYLVFKDRAVCGVLLYHAALCLSTAFSHGLGLRTRTGPARPEQYL